VPNELNSYYAGFIAADGCILGDNRLQISVTLNDELHLLKLIGDIESDKELTYSPLDNTVRLTLHSTHLVEDLRNNFNITNRKSLTYEPPTNIKGKNKKAFMSGYIDGDGCFRYGAQSGHSDWKYLILEVVGTKAFLDWFNTGLREAGSIRKVDNYYVLQSSCKKAWENHNHLWNPRLPLLERKWNKTYKVFNPRIAA
jgi:hypothetical protein